MLGSACFWENPIPCYLIIYLFRLSRFINCEFCKLGFIELLWNCDVKTPTPRLDVYYDEDKNQTNISLIIIFPS